MASKAKAKESLQNFTLKTIPIIQIKRAKYNPRREFTEAELKSFEADMDHFSCVLPLVWNERTGNLIGGHKRLDWLEKKGAKTVQVAVVNLIEKEEKLLNLALNRQGEGVWDKRKLNKVMDEFTLEKGFDIELTGFTVEADDLQIKEEELPETIFEERLFEEHQYVVLVFDNEMDWLHAKSLLGLKAIQDVHFRGTKISSSGIGRVVKGIEAFKRIAEGYGSVQQLDEYLAKGEEKKKADVD